MRTKPVSMCLGAFFVVACTTNTTVIQGGSKGDGEGCDYDSECASNKCSGGKGAAPGAGASSSGSSGEEGGEEERENGVTTSSIRPLGTCTASSSSSGGGDGGGGSSSGSVKCGEGGMYCSKNVLRSCATDAVVKDCATCKYVGSGTGSEYDTTCKDEASDCMTCNSTKPWSGPGCYFGAGPAVCR